MDKPKPRIILPKFILIDDEVQMTKLLKLIIQDHLDGTIETYNDPFAALARLSEAEFDVISLDQKMPGMVGTELVKALRTGPANPNGATPVLIFTGYREEAEGLAKEFLNDLLFLEKPIDDLRYVQYLKMALEMKKKSGVPALI